MSNRLKHIAIDENNYEKLKNLGRAGDSFNDVVRRLVNIATESQEGNKYT